MDEGTRPIGAGNAYGWGWSALPLAVLLGCLLALWTGCGTPTERYRVLSFFFDGVPDPDAPPPTLGREREGGPAGPAPVVFLHKPFQQGKCDACHAGSATTGLPTTPESSVCLQCHRAVLNEHPMMHGPVAAGFCLWCHSPHDSPIAHLLRAPAPQLCLQCHERDLLSPTPSHRDPKANCLDCHYGHGGDKRPFLREALPAPETQPATPGGPATQPAPPSPMAEAPGVTL